jgi:hypothetical protein
MKTRMIVVLGVCAGLAWSLGSRALGTAVAPPVGASTTNAITYTVNPNGTITSSFDPTTGNPYDGFDDYTVAIVNNSAQSVSSISLNGPNIFGFDGDGQAAFTGTFYGPNQGNGGYSYQGPRNTFQINNVNSGTVVFTTPLRPASPTAGPDSTWWSMEGAPTSALFGNVGLDEQGHGSITGTTSNTFTGTLQNDPTGGLPGKVLVYNLPVSGVVAGDVLLFDATTPGALTPSDIVRFDGQGHAIFYSIIEAGQNQLADTGLPAVQMPNKVSLTEMADPQNPAVTLVGYVPTAGQPGFDSTGTVPSYTLISDAPVPEPATLAVVGMGVALFLARGRRK